MNVGMKCTKYTINGLYIKHSLVRFKRTDCGFFDHVLIFIWKNYLLRPLIYLVIIKEEQEGCTEGEFLLLL